MSAGLTVRAFLHAEADRDVWQSTAPQVPLRLDPNVVEREQNVILRDEGVDDPTTPVTLEKLTQTLKKHKHKRPFDEDVVHSIFELAIMGTDGTRRTTTWGRFIDTYLKKRHEVARGLSETSERVKLMKLDITHCQQQLNIITDNPSMAGSKEPRLVVQIVSSAYRNAPPGDLCALHLECASQVIQTQPQKIQSDGSVLWNEVFAFLVKSPDGVFRARVFKLPASEHYDPLMTTSASLPEDVWEFCGSIELPVAGLADQSKHVVTRDISEGLEGSITFAAQWLFDEQLFYESNLKTMAESLRELEYDLAEKQTAMAKYDLPFGAAGVNKSTSVSKVLTAAVTHPDAVLSEALNYALLSMHATNYQKASQVVVAILVLASVLGCFSRALFLDMLIGGYAFWCNLDVQRWTSKRYIGVILFTTYSLVLDGVWNYVNLRIWSSSSADADLYLIAKVFSLVISIWKVVFILFCWKCRYDLVHYGYLPTDTTKVY